MSDEEAPGQSNAAPAYRSVSSGELLPDLQFEPIDAGDRPVAAFVMICVENEAGERFWYSRHSEGRAYDAPAFGWQLSTWLANEFAVESRAWRPS